MTLLSKLFTGLACCAGSVMACEFYQPDQNPGLSDLSTVTAEVTPPDLSATEFNVKRSAQVFLVNQQLQGQRSFRICDCVKHKTYGMS